MDFLGVKITRLRLLIFALVVGLILAVPTLRRIVWWLLPLGSGYDDIIGAIVLFIILAVVLVEIWQKVIPNNPYNRKR